MGISTPIRTTGTGLLAALWLVSAPLGAEVYKCTDDAGQIRFQQTPCAFQATQEALDEALAELARLAEAGDPQEFADHVTRHALGGFSDSAGRTVLMLACAEGPPETCQWALEAGEDPQRRDRAGRNALAHAARAGRTDNLALLLDFAGSGRYRPGDRLDALAAAIEGGRFDTALALLEMGVDPNQPTSGGQLPLSVAIAARHVDLVRLLVRQGADPALSSGSGSGGMIPVRQALDSGNRELLSALNVGTRRLSAGSYEITVPTPEGGWDCRGYAPILDQATQRLLATETSDSVCFLAAERIIDLADIEPVGLGQFRFTWRVPDPGTAAASFSRDAERYRRLFAPTFVDEPDRIGFIQSTRRPIGASVLVSTCATVFTRFTDVLAEVQYCRYQHQAQDEVAELRARARRWQERISALNR